MVTWKIIKNHFVNGMIVGTAGYQRKLNEAAILYLDINDKLIDKDESNECFNCDKEVGEALINKSFLDEVYRVVS